MLPDLALHKRLFINDVITFRGYPDPPPPRALEEGQFHLWSNLKVLFYVYFWHRSVIQNILLMNLMNEKADLGFKVLKKGPQKQKK